MKRDISYFVLSFENQVKRNLKIRSVVKSKSREYSAYIIWSLTTIDSYAVKLISEILAISDLTLKLRSKIRFKVMRIFSIYHSLYVHNWFLSFKVDNKRDISHFVLWPWIWSQRWTSRSQEYSADIISYMSTNDI